MKLVEKIKQHAHTELQGAEEQFYKTANIYRRTDSYYFIPLSASTNGGIVESSPIIKQSASSRLASLGESLLSCLLHPQLTDNLAKPEHPLPCGNKAELMGLADTPSKGGFHASALAVLVQCYVGRIVFHPMSKKGSPANYYGNPEATFEVSTDLSVNELGKALRTSFSLAES